MATFSHANCDHPATPAARKKCRDNQKKLADGKIKDTKDVRELQNALSEAYRAQLLQVGTHSVEEILDIITNVSTSDIDKWFQGQMPEFIKIINAKHLETWMLTANYLKEHAALMGYKAGQLDYVNPVFEQIRTSLEVTGPVAFKTHIAAGGTVDQAVEVMKTTLSGSAERLSLEGARDTLTAAVESDSSNVLGYSRQTSGKACDYCLGLSREAIYDSNTFHAHDHCTCTGEPIYLDPRFLPTASQVDFNENWERAVDTQNRALQIDRKTHEWNFELGGTINESMIEDFGPMLVWRELVDGVTHPYVRGISDKAAMRGKAGRIEDAAEAAQWTAYANALRAYTSEIYDSMNRLLRGLPRAEHRADMIKGEGTYLSDNQIREFNKNLLEYFKKDAAILPDDYQLYRGIKDAKVVFGDYADGDLTGMVFTDKGFTSTTISEKTAKHFIDNAHDVAPNPVMMRIIGKKGTKVVGGNGTEAEVIFAPGVRYRIVRDYEKTVGTGLRKPQTQQRWLDVEVVDSVEEMAKELASREKEIEKIFEEEFAKLFKEQNYSKAYAGVHGQDSIQKILNDFAGTEDFDLLDNAMLAIAHYTDYGYIDMNKFLRQGITGEVHSMTRVKQLNKFMESKYAGALENDIAVYRGIKDGHKVFGDLFDENLKGLEYTDKGYVSTSVNKTLASNFTKGRETPAPAVLRIIVPKGSKALKGNSSEKEIILNAGTKYRVVEDKVIKGVRTIDIEVIK